MKLVNRSLAPASLIAICVITVTAARGDDGYVVTNLTSDIPGMAPNTDPVLQNA